MKRDHVHRGLGVALLVGVWLLPLACNMPAPISGAGAGEGEAAWEWVEVFRAFLAREPVSTSPVAPGPLMPAVNEALNSQMESGPLAPMLQSQYEAYVAPQADFSCTEQAGTLVSYLDQYPSEESLESNSVQNKDFLFFLFQDEAGGFDMTWKLSYEVLHRIVDSREGPVFPKVSHERVYESQNGEGNLAGLEFGQYSGALLAERRSVGEAGNEFNTGTTTYKLVYHVAGM